MSHVAIKDLNEDTTLVQTVMRKICGEILAQHSTRKSGGDWLGAKYQSNEENKYRELDGRLGQPIRQ